MRHGMLFMAVIALLVASGCSQNREEARGASGSSSTESASYSYPHPASWEAEHVGFVSRFGHSIQGSNRDCNVCHTTSSARPMNISCAMSCHAPSTGNPMPAVPTTPARQGADCMRCHSGHFQRAKTHYPAAAGLCRTCHEVSGEHVAGSTPRGVVTRNAEQSCNSCHFRVDRYPQIHAAIQNGAACSNCHDSHGSSERFFLKSNPERLCLSCHDLGLHAARVVHGVMRDERSCLNCHTPHSGEHRKLLLGNNSKELCLSCHTGPVEGQAGRIIRAMGPRVSQMPFVHGPVREDEGCVSCHSPHASPFPNLVTRAYPDSSYSRYLPASSRRQDTYALCFACHDPSMLNRDLRTGSETGFRNDTLQDGRITRKNLHWFHVVDAAGHPDKQFGRTCSTCHDVHGSEQSHQIRGEWPMSPRHGVQIEFSGNRTGGQCTRSCHDVRTYRRLD